MWDSIVYTQLYHLRIDHDQTHFIRRCLVKNADDQGIDTYRFTGTRSSRDQKMRHLGNIRYNRFTGNILTCCKGKFGFCIFEFVGLQKIPKHNRTVFFIWDFDSHSRFSRNRRFNTDIRRCQVQFNIIGKSDDLADFHTHFRLKFIAGYRRSAADIGNCYIYSEIMKCLLKFLGCFS